MKTIGTVCTLIVFALAVWVAMNWQTIKTAWTYRAQIEEAAAVAGDLSTLGILK